MKTTMCKSCGARIFFAVSNRTGKRIPLDVDPNDNGNAWVTGFQGSTPLIDVQGQDHQPPLYAVRYISHFATCSDPKRHRRRAG